MAQRGPGARHLVGARFAHHLQRRLGEPEQAGGAEPGLDLTAGLLVYLADRVARFKLPRTIGYVAELPRDPNGKLYKRRLRDPYWTGRDRSI